LLVHSSSGRYGADRQLGLIASGLDRGRFEPIAVLPQQGVLADDLRAVGVEVLIRPLGVLRRGLMSPRGLAGVVGGVGRDAFSLSALIRRRGVALVHSNTSVVLGGAAAAGLARVPHVWHVREIYAGFERAWPFYRRVLGTAAALPCVSQATAAQFGRGRRTRVLLDGLAVETSRAPRGVARAALGLEENVPVVALVGRISTWKGQDVLVRALAEPDLRERGTVGLVVGDAWEAASEPVSALRSLADRLGVADRVRLLGFRDDVENVYGAADLIAVPSTRPDPSPGSAIEAAAAGCAVIASDHGGLPEIIRDRETGRLVAPGDASGLARIAAELLDDHGERERLGAAASAAVGARFAPARFLEELQDLYDSVA
jgi:glycosyltransferase involved in cell wall biosynthesis